MTTGVCLYGTVRYEFGAPFEMLLHCHCSMCRKHHGASFASFVVAPYAAFRWLGGEQDVARYISSPHGARAFCPRHNKTLPPTFTNGKQSSSTSLREPTARATATSKLARRFSSRPTSSARAQSTRAFGACVAVAASRKLHFLRVASNSVT